MIFGPLEFGVPNLKKGPKVSQAVPGKFVDQETTGRSWNFSPKSPDSMWDFLCLGAGKNVQQGVLKISR